MRNDRLVWPMTRNRVYIVRSGYHWVYSSTVQMMTRPISTSFSIPSQVWKVIWKLKTPPKIRCFMWKAFGGALATMEALFRRRCSPTPICPICYACVESLEHMLLLCPWFETLWFGGSLNYKVDRGALRLWQIGFLC